MKVTPLDIRRKEFKRSMRGYSDEEVDVFLDDVADEFERLFQENIELNDRIGRLEDQIAGHAQMKDALEKTLISAQLQADEIKANARKESELVLQEAELKARGIVNESYSETQRVQQALIQLKHLEEDFRYKFRSLLEGHLKLLNEEPITAPATETRALAADVTGEAEPPLVVASPEVAPPGVAAPAEAVAPPEVAPEEELPTEETETEAEAVLQATAAQAEGEIGEDEEFLAPSVAAADEATAETVAQVAPAPVAPKTPEADEPTGGFFFGRQPDDIDDTFEPPEDQREKARDFEW